MTTLGKPQDSRFLRELTEYLNIYTKTGLSVGAAFSIDPNQFAAATLLTQTTGTGRIEGTKYWTGTNPTNPGADVRFLPEAAASAHPRGNIQPQGDLGRIITGEDFNATLGGAQISAWLTNKKLEWNPFEDPWFTAFVLNMYSDIKIGADGSAKQYSYDTPDAFERFSPGDRSWNTPHVKFLLKSRGWGSFIKNDVDAEDQPPFTGQNRFVGIFETKENIDKYDDYFKDRIAPTFFGALESGAEPALANGNRSRIPVPNLCELFMNHLTDNPTFEDDNERRLFLLMGGQHYGENDQVFMNIMGESTYSPTGNENLYDRHPKEVLEYWPKFYEQAVAKEGPKSIDSYKVLQELIGSPITKNTFANFITHGAPATKPWANKVFPITTYSEKDITSYYAPFVTTVKKNNSHKLTLVFRNYQLGNDNYRLDQIGDLWGKDLSRAERKEIPDDERLFYEVWDLRNKKWACDASDNSARSDEPGTDMMAGQGSYLNNWPRPEYNAATSNTGGGHSALGDFFVTLTSDYRKAFKEAEMSYLPKESTMQEWMKTSTEGFRSGTRTGNLWTNGDLDRDVIDIVQETADGGGNNEHGIYKNPLGRLDKPSGPRIGPWIKIPKESTILDYNPARNMDSLLRGLHQAIANSVDEGVTGGVEIENSFIEDATVGKKIFEPLSLAMLCLDEEWKAFEQRVKYFEEWIKKGKTNEVAAAQVTLYMDQMPDAQDSALREYYILQIWLDSVNSAAVKVNEWLRHQQTVTQCVQRFCVIRYLKDKKKSIDEIKEILKSEGIAPGKAGTELNTPYRFELPQPTTDADVDLDPEEIKKRLEERTKNIDQCLLLTNIEKFRKAYHEDILEWMEIVDDTDNYNPEAFTIHRKKTDTGYISAAFGDRFHMLGDSKGQFGDIPNKLLAPSGDKIRPFLDLSPELQAALLPKIRLFRVTDENGKEIEKEFLFENFISSDEITSLQDASSISRGRGGGIKSFSWSYEGTTPATAKKDINAELVLYFQSFDELTKVRGKPGKEYKYIDLLLYPTQTDSIHPNEYQPSNFRIRADVGWQPRSDHSFRDLLFAKQAEKIKKQIEEQELEGEDAAKFLRDVKDNTINKLKTAIELMNKSFLLNKIDHDIDFRNDGTVEIKITYAAYVESLSKTAKVNALSTPQIEFFRAAMQDKLKERLESSECRREEINALRVAQAARENKLLKAAQGSIAKRLKNRNLYRTAVFDRAKVKEYLKNYATEAPAPQGDNLLDKVAVDREKETEVGYYFLGDIIHTIMDCLYMPVYAPADDFDPQGDITKEYFKRIKGMERYVPLLSSFVYTDYNSKIPLFAANIADVPISAKYFSEWMVNNVVKAERTIYPLMSFIKDIVETVVDLMTEVCINRQIDVSLMFQTTQIRGVGKSFSRNQSSTSSGDEEDTSSKKITKWIDRFRIIKDKTYDVLAETTDVNLDPLVIYTNEVYNTNDKLLPIPQGDYIDGKRVPLEGYYDYTLIYPVSPTLSATHQGNGNRFQDESRGTYHFQIGLNRGLMKNIKFSKTEMAYLREARYYNQGTYGLLQLGAVHNVDIELFGNTLFYPGMEIFIDPRNFGGSHWDPTSGGRNRSVANQLGIGGYHVITKVDSSISPQGYNTKLTALFQYSGDGESRTMAIDGKTMQTSDEETQITDATPKRTLKCVEAVDNALQKSILVNSKSRKANKKFRKVKVDY